MRKLSEESLPFLEMKASPDPVYRFWHRESRVALQPEFDFFENKFFIAKFLLNLPTFLEELPGHDLFIVAP